MSNACPTIDMGVKSILLILFKFMPDTAHGNPGQDVMQTVGEVLGKECASALMPHQGWVRNSVPL